MVRSSLHATPALILRCVLYCVSGLGLYLWNEISNHAFTVVSNAYDATRGICDAHGAVLGVEVNSLCDSLFILRGYSVGYIDVGRQAVFRLSILLVIFICADLLTYLTRRVDSHSKRATPSQHEDLMG